MSNEPIVANFEIDPSSIYTPVRVLSSAREGEVIPGLVRFSHLNALGSARMEVAMWSDHKLVNLGGKQPRLMTADECFNFQLQGRTNAAFERKTIPEPVNMPMPSTVVMDPKTGGGRTTASARQRTKEELDEMYRQAMNNINARPSGAATPDWIMNAIKGSANPQTRPGSKPSLPPSSDMSDYVTKKDFEQHQRQNENGFTIVDDKVDKVALQLQELLDRPKDVPMPVIVQLPDAQEEPVNIGLQHYLFPVLLKIVHAGCNAYLPGPAGSGKTRGCREVAKALKLPFYFVSVCEETSASALLGYMDAQGRYVRSALRNAFENGGVFLLDEMDAGNANTLTVINAITSTEVGETAAFPDGMIERHRDFRFVAAGNTFGTGASFHYVGRNRLDAATLDRMAYLRWPVDESLEAALVGVAKPRNNPILDFGGIPEPVDWLDMIDKCRHAANEHDLKLILSPRCVVMGVRLAKAGIGMAFLKDLLIYKDLPDSSQEILQNAMGA